MSGKILVTGGTGFIGSAVISALRESGREVHALVRSEAAAVRVEELGAAPVRGDVLDASSLVNLPPDVEIAIHLAAVPIVKAGNPPKKGPFDAVRASRVEGTRNLLAALESGPRPRLLVTASAGAYRPGPERHAEGDALWTDNRYGALIAEWEEASRSDSTPTVRLRFPPVYGPSTTGGLGAVFLPALTAGKGPKIIGNPKEAGTYVHVDDAVSAVLAAVDRATDSGVFNVGDDRPLTPMEFASAASKAFGAGTPSSIPAFLVKMLLGKDLLELFQTPPALDCSRLKETLGWSPAYPDAAAGWAAIAAALAP